MASQKKSLAKTRPTVRELYERARVLDLDARLAKVDMLERCGWVRFANGAWFDPDTAQRYAQAKACSQLRGYYSTEVAFDALCYELERDGKV